MTGTQIQTVVLRKRTEFFGDRDTLILRLGHRTLKIAPCGDDVVSFLDALSKGGDPAALVAAHSGDDGQRDRLAVLFQTLDRRGFIERPADASGLEPRDVERFDRFLHFLSEFEDAALTRYDHLKRLRDKNVMVIGVGGLGSWCLFHMLCLGIGRLTLVDGDAVQLHNLNRSILFAEDDVGRSKVAAAKDRLLGFAPRTRIDTHETFLTGPGALAQHLRDVDFVIATADEPRDDIRFWIARACQAAGVPSLQLSGMRVGPLHVPGRTACLGCQRQSAVAQNPRLPAMLAFRKTLPKGQSGGLSPIASVTAGIAAMEILRHFVNGQALTKNALWEMDGSYVSRLTPVPRDPACPICGSAAG